MKHAAIVGAGAGSLTAYVALRYRGLHPDDVVIFDDSARPLRSWEVSTAALGQTTMRSESEGHFYPTEFPGFALLAAVHRKSIGPLLRSTVNRYHPTLHESLDHGRALARHFGMSQQIVSARIGTIERAFDPEPHFQLYDVHGTLRASASHVLLSLGHGPLRWPDAFAQKSTRAALGTGLRHAYEPKQYDGTTALIVGSGMAAANEWVNALRSGSRVIALRRRQDLTHQDLSAPRCAFGGPWLDRYHALAPEERSTVLAGLARGSFPRNHEWMRLLDEGKRDGRLVELVGEVIQATRSQNGFVDVTVCSKDGRETVRADVVVAATGFTSRWDAHDLIRVLVAEYGLATQGPHLVLADNCSIPGLSRADSAILVSGSLARWAFPASDSFAGMKYASRRFAEYVMGRPGAGPRALGAWWSMVKGGWPYGAAGAESWLDVEPCAIP